MKNHEGYSPLDISLERDSTKTTDMFLQSLVFLPDGSYSEQLYQKFPDLIFKNLKAFHIYIDSCFFKTIQMKNMKYLSLKKDTDTIVTAHSSWVLDRHFLEKHTRTEQGENKEYILKKRLISKEKERLEKEMKRVDQEEHKLKLKKEKEDALARNEGGVDPQDIHLNINSESKDNAENNYSKDVDEEDEDVDEEDEDEDEEESKNKEDRLSLKHNISHSFKKDHGPGSNFSDIIAEKARITKEKTALEKKEEMLEKHRKKEQEKLKKGLKRFSIQAVEFDWLFNEKEGKAFLYALSKTDDIEIFGLNIISTIVMFLWGYYRTQIVIQVLIPFLLYFIVFILYSTWIKNESDEEDKDFGSKYFDVHFAMLISIIVGI